MYGSQLGEAMNRKRPKMDFWRLFQVIRTNTDRSITYDCYC